MQKYVHLNIKCACLRQKWRTWGHGAQNLSPETPKWPRSRLKATPGAPKASPRDPKWSPRAPPEPPKTFKKGVQNDPGRFFEKPSVPSCENPIIYYVFEWSLCENTIIYYVLVRSGILIFLKTYENTIPVHVFEGHEKPVLAWEREARWKEECCPKNIRKAAREFTFLFSALLGWALLCFARLWSSPVYSIFLFSLLPQVSFPLSWRALLDSTLLNSPPTTCSPLLCYTVICYALLCSAVLFSALLRSALLCYAPPFWSVRIWCALLYSGLV